MLALENILLMALLMLIGAGATVAVLIGFIYMVEILDE